MMIKHDYCNFLTCITVATTAEPRLIRPSFVPAIIIFTASGVAFARIVVVALRIAFEATGLRKTQSIDSQKRTPTRNKVSFMLLANKNVDSIVQIKINLFYMKDDCLFL